MKARWMAAAPRPEGVPVPAPASVAVPQPAGGRHHVGRLREARIRGWAIGAGGGPAEIRVLAGGVPVPVDVRRLGRPDLLPALPGHPVAPIGFVAEIDPAAWRHAEGGGSVALRVALDGRVAEPALALDARLLAAWCDALAGWRRPDERELWRLLAHVAASGLLARLPRRAAAWARSAAAARGLEQALGTGDAEGRIALGARLHLRVDRLRALDVEGWAIFPDDAPAAFALTCNGQPVAVDAGWLARPELEEALRASTPPRGFLIELPVAAWAHADASGACAVRITLHGRELLAEPWRIDAAALRAEREALEPMAHEHEPARRAQALRRLALLRAHAAAIPGRSGWGAGDAAALAALGEAFESVETRPAPPGAADDGSVAGGMVAAAAPPAPGATAVRANLEAWEQFILQGWVVDAAAGGEVLTLECNGEPVEIYVARTSRVDVSQALGVDHEYPGFEIQVPAAIWRAADARGVCLLTLRANGLAIHAEPLLLDDAALERAIAQVLPGPGEALPSSARAAGMRLRLTALPLLLEHVEARGGAHRLSGPARERLARAGSQLALGDMLGLSGPTLAPADAERAQAIRRRRVWRLQRLLNARIARRGGLAPGVLDAALAEVLEDPDATGEVRTELAMSVVPLSCDDPALDRLARELPHDVVDWLSQHGDNWARSIRLALQVHAGDLAGAAEQLDRIAETPAHGWINTEAIALAVRSARDSPRIDPAGLRARAAIVQAFARLLDRMPGDAWSRLQDRRLVEATADLLRADGPWFDALAGELVRVALRCHALVPQFWERLGETPAGLANDARVRTARADVDAARAALRALDARAGVPAGLPAVLDRLALWHARGQRDAMQWMRELALAALAQPAAAAGGDVLQGPALDALRQRLDDLFEAGDLGRLERLPALLLRPRPDATRGLGQRIAADRAILAGAPGAVAAGHEIEAAAARLARMLPAVCTPDAGRRGRSLAAEVLQEATRAGVGGAALTSLRAVFAAMEAAVASGDAIIPAADETSLAHETSPDREKSPSHETSPVHEASLWPTTAAADPGLAHGGNRLRLLSGPERLQRLEEARLLVVCVVRDERILLPHFLAHHRALGATAFVVIDNLSSDGTREFLEAQPDVVVYLADTDYRDSHFGVAWQQAVLAAHSQGRWALLVDADEFLLYPGCEDTPLPALLDRLEAADHDAASTPMIDLYPRGPLREADFSRTAPAAAAGWFDRTPLLRWYLGGGLYSNAPTWLSALRHRLIPHSPPNAFTAQKIALLRWRPWMRLSEGLHYVAGARPSPQPLFLGHYKYHAGFREKVLREVERKQHFDAASEYVHYLHLVAEPDATLFEPAVSVPLADSRALPDLGEAAR